jgi:8-oxo-dGTP diphosphatase
MTRVLNTSGCVRILSDYDVHAGRLVTNPIIRVVAAYITNPAGELLLVRKRGTDAFMNPGGKYELGETAPQTLVRELGEELGLVIAEADLDYVGSFETDAANEPGHLLEAEVYRFVLETSVSPLAEIEELRWVDPRALGSTTVAPLVHLLV